MVELCYLRRQSLLCNNQFTICSLDWRGGEGQQWNSLNYVPAPAGTQGDQTKVFSWSADWSCRSFIAGLHVSQILTILFLPLQVWHTRKSWASLRGSGLYFWSTSSYFQVAHSSLYPWDKVLLILQKLFLYNQLRVERGG